MAILHAAAHAEEDASARVRELFSSATAHYNLGEFKEALEDFKAAYRLRQDPSFLFNIAQCYRQLGDPQNAARQYRAYLRESPSAPNRAEVERQIAAMDKATPEAKPAELKPPTPPPGPEPPPEPTVATPVVTAPPAPRPSEAPRWYRNAAGWTFVAAGVALFGVGLGLAAYGVVRDGQVASSTGFASLEERERIFNTNGAFETVGSIGIGVGAAAVVAGGVLFAMKAKKPAAVSLVPVISPLAAMASLGGSF